METTSKMAAAQETGLRNDEPARSAQNHPVGVATPRVSINVADTRPARALSVKAQVEKLGRKAEAKVEFEKAASMTQNSREKTLLFERARKMSI